MKVTTNRGSLEEWSGEWSEFCEANSDAFSNTELDQIRKALVSDGFYGELGGAGAGFVIDTVIELDSIGHALNPSTGMLYPIQAQEWERDTNSDSVVDWSGRYDIENAVPLDEADDLSMISAHDLAIITEYTANAQNS